MLKHILEAHCTGCLLCFKRDFPASLFGLETNHSPLYLIEKLSPEIVYNAFWCNHVSLPALLLRGFYMLCTSTHPRLFKQGKRYPLIFSKGIVMSPQGISCLCCRNASYLDTFDVRNGGISSEAAYGPTSSPFNVMAFFYHDCFDFDDNIDDDWWDDCAYYQVIFNFYDGLILLNSPEAFRWGLREKYPSKRIIAPNA